MSTRDERIQQARDKHVERLVRDGAPGNDGRWRPLTTRESEDRASQMARDVDKKKKSR